MAKVIAVTEAVKSLAEAEARFGLQRSHEAAFFPEWRQDWPELTAREKAEVLTIWHVSDRVFFAAKPSARMRFNSNSCFFMTDRTPEQINQTIDRLLEVAAETSRNIDRLEAAIGQTNDSVQQTNIILQEFIQSGKTRLLSLETSREQEEEKVEELQNQATRLGRADMEQQARLDRMDGIIARYDRMHLEHEDRMAQMRQVHQEQLAQMRAEHQERLDRQDHLIELLSRREG
jgi:hypothetical protein